jgi:uncharacterized protein YfiM (DUF2279 family)
MNRNTILFVLLFVLTFSLITYAQNDSVLRRRKLAVTLGTATAWAAGSLALYSLWYKDYPSSSFHSFNDNAEWMQMDKAGHFFTAAATAAIGYEAFTWAGYHHEKALWIGTGIGWSFLTTLEILDGFNTQWGFSWGDMAANSLGSLSMLLQQCYWKEQKVYFKASFHHTRLSGYRPDLLGKNWYEEVVKDYNGQTYWISVNPASFNLGKSCLPAWLNIAVGYGAYGMLGGRENPPAHQGSTLLSYDRYRRYFLSPDIAFSRLPVKNKTLKVFLKTLDYIKIPLPTLEYNSSKGFQIHPLYF